MKLPLLTILAGAATLGVGAQTTADLASSLESMGCYRANARFEVLMPNADTPVGYDVAIESVATQGDSLSPADYYIAWKPLSANGGEGFSAYFDGNYFRYSGGKLQENHAAKNPEPFAPGGNLQRGVQHTDRFAALLPHSLGTLMREMSADTAYHVALSTNSMGNILVKGRREMRGYVVSEFTYEFSPEAAPLRWETTSNPGEMAEQVVTVTYTPSSEPCRSINEALLTGLHPEEFEKYRRDSFTLANLPGNPLPGFSAATTDGGRYTRLRGDEMGQPTLIAVTSGAIDGNRELLADLRSALDALPFSVNLIVAFVDTDTDAIEEAVGATIPGETILRNARSLVRNCGVVDYPSIIFVKPDGTVASIHVGRNNKLRDIVIKESISMRN